MLTLKLIRLTKRYCLKRIGIFFSLQYKSKPSPLLLFTLKSPISNENTVQIQIIKALQDSDNRQFLNSRNTDYFSERKAEPGTIPINPCSQPLPFHPTFSSGDDKQILIDEPSNRRLDEPLPALEAQEIHDPIDPLGELGGKHDFNTLHIDHL